MVIRTYVKGYGHFGMRACSRNLNFLINIFENWLYCKIRSLFFSLKFSPSTLKFQKIDIVSPFTKNFRLSLILDMNLIMIFNQIYIFRKLFTIASHKHTNLTVAILIQDILIFEVNSQVDLVFEKVEYHDVIITYLNHWSTI